MSDDAGKQVLNHEEKLAPDDKESQTLLAALNTFRDYIKPKGVITTGKHFNMQLLSKAFKLYDQNYDTFGGRKSFKNNLRWQKVIGYMQRFSPVCYAQAFVEGVYFIVEESRGPWQHFFNARHLSQPISVWNCGFLPLDSVPNFRLGYNCAVNWSAFGSLGAGDRPIRLVASSDGRVLIDRVLGELCQAKTAALQRIMQHPCNSQSKCLVM